MFDTKKFCRICAREGCILIELSTLDKDNIKLSDKLKYCVQEIVIDNDCLPNYICDTCCYNLKISYSFKKSCLKTRTVVSDVLNNETCNGKILVEPSNTEKVIIKEEPLNDDEEFSSQSKISEDLKDCGSSLENICSNCQNQCSISELKTIDNRSLCKNCVLCCNKCSDVFSKPKDLDEHYEQVHKTVLPITDEIEISYVCSICHFRYPYQRLLLAHMRAHSGERPYKCSICRERFAWQHHLKRHLQRHDSDKRDCFPCTVCSKRFPNVAKLQMHMRQHSNKKLAEVEEPREYKTRSGRFGRYIS